MATYISNDSPTFFYIVTILFCIVLIVTLGIAASNYNTVANLTLPADETAARVTRQVRTSANAMMWVCIIMAVVAFIILIWGAFKLLTRKNVTVNADLNPAIYATGVFPVAATSTGPTAVTSVVAQPQYVQVATPADSLLRREDVAYLMDL